MSAYDAVLGTLLVGIIFNTYLWGIVSTQYAHYHNTKFNDPLHIKLSVCTLFIIDTVQSILMVYLGWFFLVDNFTNPAIFLVPQWTCAFIPIGTVVTATITHIFLGMRMYGMSKNQSLFGLILLLTLAEFGTGVALGARMWTMQNMGELYQLKPFIIPWLIIQTTLDLFVAGLMSYFLRKYRTGYMHTDTVINRLIRGAIQTGVFSVVLAISGLIAFLVKPNSIFYAMFMIPIGRTYTTTLIDTLNIRTALKERLHRATDVNGSDFAWEDPQTEAGYLTAMRPRDTCTIPKFTTANPTEDSPKLRCSTDTTILPIGSSKPSQVANHV